MYESCVDKDTTFVVFNAYCVHRLWMNITLEWMHSLVELIKGKFLHLQKRLGLWGVCVMLHQYVFSMCIDISAVIICFSIYLILAILRGYTL